MQGEKEGGETEWGRNTTTTTTIFLLCPYPSPMRSAHKTAQTMVYVVGALYHLFRPATAHLKQRLPISTNNYLFRQKSPV